jgi:hypothetical protein
MVETKVIEMEKKLDSEGVHTNGIITGMEMKRILSSNTTIVTGTYTSRYGKECEFQLYVQPFKCKVKLDGPDKEDLQKPNQGFQK